MVKSHVVYIVKVEESCTRLSRSTETERIQDSSALAPVSHLVSRNIIVVERSGSQGADPLPPSSSAYDSR
jgi:hypothetical protein